MHMICLLDGLCIDVRNMIHRYIFDYHYSQLQRQYKKEWLSGSWKCGVYWNDDDNMFSCDQNPEANWRNVSQDDYYESIYRFRMLGDDLEEQAMLPSRYIFTNNVMSDNESD